MRLHRHFNYINSSEPNEHGISSFSLHHDAWKDSKYISRKKEKFWFLLLMAGLVIWMMNLPTVDATEMRDKIYKINKSFNENMKLLIKS